MRVDPEFESLLVEGLTLDRLENERGTVYGIFSDGRLALTNSAWDRFAAENGAPEVPRTWPIGRNIYEAIPSELQPFYREGWEWTAESGHPWSHSYDCSSANDYRRYRMTSYPVGGTAGVLVVNSLVAEAPWPAGTPATPSRGEYRQADGSTVQCSHCRRSLHIASGRWDWVPEWVQRWPDEARSTLCDTCTGYHYYGEVRGVPLTR